MRAGASQRTGGRYRLVLGTACLAAALLTGLLLRPLLGDWQQNEWQKLELYWNGYVQMYMDLNGSLDGLSQRLAGQGYLHAWDRGLSLRWIGMDGTGEVLLGEADESAAGRQLPVMRERQIIGYTQASLAASPWADYVQYGIPGGVALLLYGLGEWMRVIANRARSKERAVIAKELGAYLHGASRKRSYDTGGKPLSAPSPHSNARSGGGNIGTAETPASWPGDGADASPKTPSAGLHRNSGEVNFVFPWRDMKGNAEEAWAAILMEVDQILLRIDRLETVRRSMVADIAHELRTPISIMRTTLDHALQTGDCLDTAKAAALHDETLRLTRLVRELQELSLAESGHLPLDKTWFVLSEVVEEVLETLSVEGEERGIRYSLEAAGGIMLYGDKSRIRQIVINLAGNAFRHSVSRVEARILTEGSFVVLEIGDDGLGIEQEELESVFERFYRSPSTDPLQRKERSTGLGLGLAIVREFSRAHGGEAEVRSQYGQGAVFTVKIPVMEE
ncbi:sensor histidine kinase [Paenibacillus sp. CAU 1782]